MKQAYLTVRSLFLWAISGIHFAVLCTFLVLLGLFIDPRKNDWPQRAFFRNIIRLAGARFEVKRSPGFDPTRTSIFICNHVNLFDAFVIYSAIPQFVRGFELESHFRFPIYGWMMGRFGNIPVPDAPSREGLETMTNARRPRSCVQERNFQYRATIRRANRAHEHHRGLRVVPNRKLDALSRENYGLPARYDRYVERRPERD